MRKTSRTCRTVERSWQERGRSRGGPLLPPVLQKTLPTEAAFVALVLSAVFVAAVWSAVFGQGVLRVVLVRSPGTGRPIEVSAADAAWSLAERCPARLPAHQAPVVWGQLFLRFWGEQRPPTFSFPHALSPRCRKCVLERRRYPTVRANSMRIRRRIFWCSIWSGPSHSRRSGRRRFSRSIGPARLWKRRSPLC